MDVRQGHPRAVGAIGTRQHEQAPTSSSLRTERTAYRNRPLKAERLAFARWLSGHYAAALWTQVGGQSIPEFKESRTESCQVSGVEGPARILDGGDDERGAPAGSYDCEQPRDNFEEPPGGRVARPS